MMIYFATESVSLSGNVTDYTRIADSGNELTHGFCPVCGSPFYLKTPLHPGGIGIAAGVFETQAAAPVRSIFEENRFAWVNIPEDAQRFPRGRRG